ncbi:hypothetical protein [Pragia fontium]|uniref:hypothetical protein n=1 Tax=Pragia fontium TaxID=82985 RepID=UPI00064A0500|nr:hypothetical protein [Pragia fontium]AKJ42192.1 hypothetical protein QQ39_08915 [Pragia fontium]
MHNYIINDRVLFNTYTGVLSRLDDPKQLSTLSSHAKQLFLRLIDSGYQIIPFEQLSVDVKERSDLPNVNAQITAELDNIVKSFQQIGEYEPMMIVYSYGVQLSTDVELKVISSYRSFNENEREKPYIAKESVIDSTVTLDGPTISVKSKNNRFIWYYTRIVLVISLSIFLLYFALNLFSSKPDYFADYHYQGKYQQCSVFIHNQKPTDLVHLKLRLEEFNVACDTPHNIYVSIPADDRRESYQVCGGNPDQEQAPCVSYYVVKVK